MTGNNSGYDWANWRRSDGMRDLITAVCILVFAVGGFLFINPEGSGVYPGDDGMTWQTMPFIYSGLLLALACVYIIQSLRQIRREAVSPDAYRTEVDPDTAKEEKIIFKRRMITLVMLLVYVSLLRTFGFAVMTPIFLFALFRLFQRGQWKGDALISLVGSFFLWILFVRILHLNLQGGDLDPVTPFLLNSLKLIGL